MPKLLRSVPGIGSKPNTMFVGEVELLARVKTILVCDPGAIFRPGGDAVREKGAAVLTAAVKLTECEIEPLIPTAVMVFDPTGEDLEAAIVKY